MEQVQNKIKISQSLMKDYEAYVFGKECGLVLKEKYINGNFFSSDDPDDAMNMGSWFEFQCTGSLPKSGKIVEPSRLKKGDNKGDLNAKYRVLQTQFFTYKKIMAEYGFEIIEAGRTIRHGDLEGTIDIVARRDGKVCFIDIKTSGLINDKWSDYGWEEIEHKPMITIQATHYKLLGMLEFNEEPDFYFFVFSTANENDAKIIKCEIDKDRFDQHIKKAQYIKEAMLTEEFEARPQLRRCAECPLNLTCKSKIEVPEIQTVYIA